MIFGRKNKETTQNKIFYNEASAHKLGWTPQWFNENEFDEDLIYAIEEFQKNCEDIEVDGLCGPTTFRRIYTLKEAQFKLITGKNPGIEGEKEKKYILCNDKKVTIEWDKVIVGGDVNALVLESGYRRHNGERKPKQFVIHWDAALSSKSCFDILKRRGLSVQFSIDNDGTIYQFVDCNEISQHVGFPCNDTSIGVEMSNAVYTKYQNHYVKEGFGKRPIIAKTKVHKGYYGPMLGFYPVQINALKALLKCVCTHYNIPFQVPLKGSKLINTVHKKTNKELKEWKGICCHYHLDYHKYDVAGLDLKEIVESLK